MCIPTIITMTKIKMGFLPLFAGVERGSHSRAAGRDNLQYATQQTEGPDRKRVADVGGEVYPHQEANLQLELEAKSIDLVTQQVFPH